jgi:AcrR family transcriptional regulator
MSPRRARAVVDRPGLDHAAALREHLVEVAHRLLGTSPISALTTRHLARSAGVSEGVLYNYFGDKGDLIVAGLVRRFEELTQRFDARVPAAGDGTVEANLATLAEAAEAMQEELIPIFVGLLNEPDLLRRFIVETHREPLMPRGRIAAYIAGEQRLGRVDPGVDGNAVTMLLMGAMFMGALGRHLLPDDAPARPATRADPIVATLLDGLRPAAGRAATSDG